MFSLFFFNFREEPKKKEIITPCCTGAICDFLMGKRKIEYVEGFVRYGSYKLMNLACLFKKPYTFQCVCICFFNFQKKYPNTPPPSIVKQLRYIVFPYARGK